MPKKKVARWSLAIFLTVIAILVFYDTLSGRRVLLGVLDQLLYAIRPVLYGAFIAYLLAPVIDKIEMLLFSRRLARSKSRGKLFSHIARAVSIFLTWVILCILTYLLFSIMIPQLYRSVVQLIGNIENYYAVISGWVENLLVEHPRVEQWVSSQMDSYYKDAFTWLTTQGLPKAQAVMTAVSGGVVTLLIFLKNLLIGVIVSIYFLATKERCGAHCKKLTCAIFPREQVYWIFRGADRANKIFSGFVRGKLLDSLIIGLLCFIGCSLLHMPYTPLIALIVGITNIIPFFGPFLGAIPSLFLILLVNPLQALYFLIFILALQQLDGNVIGPKILGDQTGLSSLLVIVAILIGGSFFGVAGMFFGVPVCACLYSLITFLINRKLRNRDLPMETMAYAVGKTVYPAADGGPEGSGEVPETEDAPAGESPET